MPKHYEPILIGKGSECWKCGLTFFIDGRVLGERHTNPKPICDDCLAIAMDSGSDIVRKIGDKPVEETVPEQVEPKQVETKHISDKELAEQVERLGVDMR